MAVQTTPLCSSVLPLGSLQVAAFLLSSSQLHPDGIPAGCAGTLLAFIPESVRAKALFSPLPLADDQTRVILSLL